MERENMVGDNKDPVFKIVILGNSGFIYLNVGVGKSSILMYYTKGYFQDEYIVTIGLEFVSKKFRFNVNKAGQESFKSIIKAFYKNAAAVLLVYNITSQDSFEGINDWIDQVKEHGDNFTPMFLIGNQADRGSERVISFDQGLELSKKYSFESFHETSAKRGDGINDTFNEVAKKIFNYHLQNKYPTQNMYTKNITLTSEKMEEINEKQSKKCC